MTPEWLFYSFIPPKTFIPPIEISGYTRGQWDYCDDNDDDKDE